MYEPSTYCFDQHISGFKFWDGYEVLSELKPGTELAMVPEPENPFDPNAIALYYGDAKLGFIGREHNELISQLIFFEQPDVFRAYVTKVDPEAEPYKQVRITVRIVDRR